MTDRPTVHKTATRADLNAAIEQSPLHLRPILESVRDFGTAMMFVPQGLQAFRIPRDAKKPTILLVGDDTTRSDGPGGFHEPSLRRIIRASSAFAVVSSAPPVEAYEAIARMAALTRRNVLLVETRVEQELPWMELIQRLAPKRRIILATVCGGHA
jgi:hypothetical protein